MHYFCLHKTTDLNDIRMKLGKKIMLWELRALFVFIFGFLTISIGSASKMSDKIHLGGQWEYERSVPSRSFINVFLDNSNIMISNTSPNCDIIIDILDDKGGVVLQKKIIKEKTGNIVFSINSLPIGDYLLELRNPYGDYLYGFFCKR